MSADDGEFTCEGCKKHTDNIAAQLDFGYGSAHDTERYIFCSDECLVKWMGESFKAAALTDEDRRMERYEEEIEEFFEGKTYEWGREKGHIWVAQHENFDTLTVEPPEGGQYEVAVRIRGKDEKGKDIWRGYFSGILFGHNTEGH